MSVGFLYTTSSKIPLHLAAKGHITIVLSDSFRLLYKLYKKTDLSDAGKQLLIETPFDPLPIKEQRLDAIVLSHKLRLGKDPLLALGKLRELLVEGGLMVWPHPLLGTRLGALGRAFARRRSQLGPGCRASDFSGHVMAAGFAEIGQITVPGKVGSWIITTGRSHRRPWERSEQKPPLPLEGIDIPI